MTLAAVGLGPEIGEILRPDSQTRAFRSIGLSAPRPARSARLEVKRVSGQSTATAAYASAPLKLFTARARGPSVWAYSSNFGGGVVAGDETSFEIQIGGGARCFLGTQSSTKIYANAGELPCSHSVSGTLDDDGLLVFAPDPVQAFAQSSYRQRQSWHLRERSNLVLFDCFTAGRVARGERWAFSHYSSRNEVRRAGKLIFLDALVLDASSNSLASFHRVGRFNCFALLLVLGPALSQRAAEWLQAAETQPIARGGPVLGCASPVADGALLRMASERIEDMWQAVYPFLKTLAPDLGDDPWRRKW